MKPRLVWPSITEEMEASAEHRRLQRDREARSESRKNSSNSKLEVRTLSATFNTPRPKNGQQIQSGSNTTKSNTSNNGRLGKKRSSDMLTTGTAKKKGSNPDENRPPSKQSRLKQKPLDYFFRQSQSTAAASSSSSSTSTGITNNAVSKTPASTPTTTNTASDSPTPIKRAKPTIGRMRIESPAVIAADDDEIVPHDGTTTAVENGKKSNNGNGGKMKAGCWKLGAVQKQLEVTNNKKEKSKQVYEFELAERAEQDRKRVERLNKKLKSALRSLDRDAFTHEMKSAALLGPDLVATMPSPFICYLVAKEAGQHRLESTIKSMTLDERRAQRRDFKEQRAHLDNFHFDQLLASFRAGKYEDKAVLALAVKAKAKQLENLGEPQEEKPIQEEEFPAVLRPVFADQPDLARHFGRALLLTQFVYSHRHFLKQNVPVHLYKLRTSATRLLLSMSEQRASSGGVVEAMLQLLAGHLPKNVVKKVKPKVEMSKRTLRSRSVRMKIREEQPTFLDTIRPFLAKAAKEEENEAASRDISKSLEGDQDEDDEEDQIVGLSEAVAELGKADEFYELSVPSQLTILEHFVQHIESMDAFHEYLEERGQNEMPEVEEQKKEYVAAIQELRKELAELEARKVQVDDLSQLTRAQTAEINKISKLQKEKKAELAHLEEQLAQTERACMTHKFMTKQRTLLLGQDRFHRNYWFFADTPDGHAILVQQEACPYETCPYADDAEEEKNGSKSTTDENGPTAEQHFLHRLQEKVEGRPCAGNQEERWWTLNSVPAFNRLCESLLVRGVRECQLKRQLLACKELILPALKTVEDEEEDKAGMEEEEEGKPTAKDEEEKEDDEPLEKEEKEQ